MFFLASPGGQSARLPMVAVEDAEPGEVLVLPCVVLPVPPVLPVMPLEVPVLPVLPPAVLPVPPVEPDVPGT